MWKHYKACIRRPYGSRHFKTTVRRICCSRHREWNVRRLCGGISLRNGKALWKHILHTRITAASVLSKLFISGNKICHNTDDFPLAHGRHSIFNCKQHTIYDPWGPEQYNYRIMNYGATFYSLHTGTKHHNISQDNCTTPVL